jgi:hypothetical protein
VFLKKSQLEKAIVWLSNAIDLNLYTNLEARSLLEIIEKRANEIRANEKIKTMIRKIYGKLKYWLY